MKVIAMCKNGVRYDMELKKAEPIAVDEPVISTGAIVSLNGHKGKVMDVTGEKATVSWEDASMSEVDVSGLKYEGRVQKIAKGGPGSGIYERHPKGGNKDNLTSDARWGRKDSEGRDSISNKELSERYNRLDSMNRLKMTDNQLEYHNKERDDIWAEMKRRKM